MDGMVYVDNSCSYVNFHRIRGFLRGGTISSDGDNDAFYVWWNYRNDVLGKLQKITILLD